MAFEIGDIVTVSNYGNVYPCYEEWVDKNASDLKKFWLFERELDETGSTWRICAKGLHKFTERGMLYFIINVDDHSSYYTEGYVISEYGIELLRKCEHDEDEEIDVSFNKTVVLI